MKLIEKIKNLFKKDKHYDFESKSESLLNSYYMV